MKHPSRRTPVRSAAALTLFAALTACTPGTAPPSPPPGAPSPPPPAALAQPAPAPAPEAFPALRDRIVEDALRDDPSFARSLGLHEYDGKVADISAAAIRQRIARLERDRAALAAVDTGSLSPDEQLDRAILLQRIDRMLFQRKEIEDWRRKPQHYTELFAVNDYLDRAYAPLPERAKRLLEHEKAALAQVPRVRENLASPLSRPVVETAIKIYRGYAEYLRGDVVKLLQGVGDAAFQEDFARTNAALAAAAAGIADHLEKVELPKADMSHVLGEERYRKFLLAQEGVSMPLAEFKKKGLDDLAANKAAYQELAKKTKQTRPKATRLIAEATRMMDAARKFLVDRKIVTIPAEDRAMVKETPPFMRWNAAFLRDPGPFDPPGLEAYYYITMPDPSWPRKEQDEYVSPMGSLLMTTVHEVWPGHFLQGLWIRKAPTRVQQMFQSYSFVEGWAHYAEQLMTEEGFGKEDPQNRLGQLHEALLRNCRYVVSIGIHAEGMSLEEAEKRFVEDCFQDRATARQQAARATFDPGYFAYTFGKLSILELREEAKAKLGASFSLQRFHDALLAHGGAPVALLRDRVLADLGITAAK